MSYYDDIDADMDLHGDVDYEVAYKRMSAEYVTVDKDEALVTEHDVLRGLGMVSGSTLLEQLAAVLPAPVTRVLQSRGIDMAHPESKAQVEALRGTIGDTAANWLIAQSVEIKPKWPGLLPGHCQNAMFGFGVDNG